jgi:diguanylate cyclase (GGDEF)-like protein
MVGRGHPFLWLAAPAAEIAYIVAFPFLSLALGRVAGVIPDVAIVGAAWFLGMRAAVAAAAVAVIANALLYTAQGDSLTRAALTGAAIAGVSLAVAWAVNRLREDKERIERLTTLDRLTNLPRRDAFDERVQRMLGRGIAAHVALVDVVGLRQLNENFGHDVGDQVIREIARRLGESFRDGVVGRIGTDEFAVLQPATGTDDAFAARVLDAFRAPFIIGGSLVSVAGRVGVARSPEHGETSAMLRSAAESAASSIRDVAVGWAAASPTHSRDTAERLRTLEELRQALERNEMRLHYQPLLNVTSGKVVGFEALMRWQRDGKLVPPAQFIPLAEQTGFIVPLTDWLVGEALEQSAEWARAGHPVSISVNVGAKAIGASSHLETVIARAGRHQDAGRPRVRRRFRNGALVTQLSQRAAARRGQDRPLVHQPARARSADLVDRARGDRPESRARSRRGGRGHRGRGDVGASHTPRLRPRPGLLHREADAGGRRTPMAPATGRRADGGARAGGPADHAGAAP